MKLAFADESGTSAKEKCYTIGTVLVPERDLEILERDLEQLIEKHKISEEVKWTRVRRGHGLINFGIDSIRRIIQSECSYNCIVVDKSLFRKWGSNQEDAFYTTYTLLLRHCADLAKEEIQVNIDNRADSYDKHNEVVEIIGNHMLARLSSAGRLSNVTKIDSKSSLCLQVADFITGAINHAHHRFLNSKLPMAVGKKLFIERLSVMLGWNDVIYDTYPNLDFNIWHFPIEWRSVPATKNVNINLNVSYVLPSELEA